jgi:hypothetical protein
VLALDVAESRAHRRTKAVLNGLDDPYRDPGLLETRRNLMRGFGSQFRVIQITSKWSRKTIFFLTTFIHRARNRPVVEKH